MVGVPPRSEGAYLDVVEGEYNWLKFKLIGCFEPVLSRDGDPFIVGKEGICGPEVVGCREGEVCGLADGGEDVEVGEGSKYENKDDSFYGGGSSARCEGSRNGTHCFWDLVWTIRMSTRCGGAGSWRTDRGRRPLLGTAGGQGSVRATWGTAAATAGRSAWLLRESGDGGGFGKSFDGYLLSDWRYVIDPIRKPESYQQTLFISLLQSNCLCLIQTLSNSLFRDHWLI